MFEAYCREKLGPLALRLALGLVCVYHGFLKIMESGGTSWLPGLPVGWQLALAWGEFGAGVAILVGFRCRLAALAVLALTGGLLGWWQGWNLLRLPLRALEPTFVVLLMSVAVVCLGAGEIALDGRGSAGAKPARKKAA